MSCVNTPKTLCFRLHRMQSIGLHAAKSYRCRALRGLRVSAMC